MVVLFLSYDVIWYNEIYSLISNKQTIDFLIIETSTTYTYQQIYLFCN